MIDSHCHLADEVYAADLGDVVARARTAGLSDVLCVIEASDAAECARAQSVSAHWDRIRFATGVHPHRAATCSGDAARAADLVRLQLEQQPLARAIGEIGLDYHYTLASREVQAAVFSAQLALARELDLPVVVHTREADADTIRILEQIGQGQLRGVFHCFSGDRDLAVRALEMGFHVSFSAIVTFKKSERVQDAARMVPLERLLVETDCPYLAPAPHRGQRNEPAWVVRVAEAVARIHGTSLVTVSEAVTDTYRELFRP
jgi:TatD DNase family protein